MLASPYLTVYPFGLRVALLIALVSLTVWYTRRGMQNGLLLGLITGMSPISMTLFSGVGPLPNIGLDRVVWPIVFLIFFLKWRQGETERLPLDWVERSILAFTAVMLISMLSHGSYDTAEGEWNLFHVMRGYAFPFATYFIARRAIRTAQQLRAFLVGLGFIVLYLALTGIGEVLKIHWLVFPRFILNPEFGIHFGQSRGVFLNASAYGLAIAMALPFLVWLYFTDRAPRRYVWPLVAALAAVPLPFTFQRAAWLAAIVALGGTALAWPQRRIILTWSLVFAAACGLLFAPDTLTQRLDDKLNNMDTINYRLTRIQTGWAMFQAHPVVGVGFNRYGAEVEEYSSLSSALTEHAHNTWITLLAELGLVGFLSYFAIFGFALLESVKFYWQFPQYRAILGILIGVTLAFLAMSISVEVRGHLYTNALLFTLWGALLEGIRRQYALRQKRAVMHRRVINFV